MTRGRKPSQATLDRRAAEAELSAAIGPLPAHLHAPEANGDADALIAQLDEMFVAQRKALGLSSRTVREEHVVELMGLHEEYDPEWQRRHPNVERFDVYQRRLGEKHEKLSAQVKTNAKAGGAMPPDTTNHELVRKYAPQILDDLSARRISYKEAVRKLDRMQAELEKHGLARIPSERTLRRWITSIGH